MTNNQIQLKELSGGYSSLLAKEKNKSLYATISISQKGSYSTYFYVNVGTTLHDTYLTLAEALEEYNKL
tara:strand:+ start:84541 stop:84747 length:207 start_codon:yes stop_codon:yes gene_type:complete